MSWQDHETNKWIRSRTKVYDIIIAIKTSKIYFGLSNIPHWSEFIVVEPEAGYQRSGRMKSMASGTLLREERMAKTGCCGNKFYGSYAKNVLISA